MTTKPLYGAHWDARIPEVLIEIACIQNGGQWKDKRGNVCGLGLVPHYQNLQRQLWPDMEMHRWSQLCLKEMVEHNVCVLMGPKSSGKTNEAAKMSLCEYWIDPENTMVLMSSTDLRSLELRIWGECKMLFGMAKERFPFLAGHLVDSKHAITTDDIDESAVRDMRRGICFPTGTLVDTPYGPRRIETLKPGELVLNALGIGSISKVHKSISAKLVRVHLSDGRYIDCTQEHPFLTLRGWIQAIDLETCDRVLSVDEIMQNVWQSPRSGISQSQTLFRNMPESTSHDSLHSMWRIISSSQGKTKYISRPVLQSSLSRSLVFCKRSWAKTSNQALSALWQNDAGYPSQSPILFDSMSESLHRNKMPTMRKNIYINSRMSNEAEITFLQSLLQKEIFWNHHGTPPHLNNRDRISFEEIISQCEIALSCQDWFKNSQRKEPLVSNRLGFSRDKTSGGNRRGNTQNPHETNCRSETNQNFGGTWVDYVEVLEQAGDQRYQSSTGGYPVYNLSVEGHPSYSVNGVVVHNCGVPCVEGGKVTNLKKYQGIKQKRVIICADEAAAMSSSFLSAFSNLDANPYFKAFILGNPSTMQDPLGRAAEPKEGWEKYMSPDKTTCWNTRFLNGRCVNLIGTDSPNFDFPQDKKPRYPYLISKRTIDSTAAFFTKDSMEYHSQCIGDMQVSSLARQVITRLMCEQKHAFDMVTWGDAAPIKIYGIDAAYGGDRCVGGYIEWGKDITDKQMLNMHEPVIIPIRAKSDQIPEDQIAEFVMLDCLRNSIPPENVFYDATGRGSLGTSFARIWSDKTNPIEFGAAATERPVCNDLFIYDPVKRAKRLMMCKERYDRFVTELWFSFRFIVESGQFRGLTEEVMEEFTMRYWDRPKEKYRLEKKEEMKERIGRSPDLADWLATCIEGARRLGFVASRLLNSKVQTLEDIAWDDLIYEQQKLIKRHQLNYAA